MLQIEIRIHGSITQQWSKWFGDLAISHPTPGETRLAGILPDQAALYGLFSRLRDLGLELCSLSVQELGEDPHVFRGKKDR